MAYISDLHCHPSFKPYNSQGYRFKPDGSPYTIWDEVPEDKKSKSKITKRGIKKILNSMEKDSQTNLDLLVNNGFKSAFCVIHPIERGWFNINEKKLTIRFAECLYNFVSQLNQIGAWFTGIPIQKIKSIRAELKGNQKLDYFEKETLQEYRFLVESEGVKGKDGEVFIIATNYKHYQSIIAQDDYIAGILTIEGGHALNVLPKVKDFTKPYEQHTPAKQRDIRTGVLTNIERIKGIGEHEDSFKKEHAPLFITLSHFYNNFLAGHARSYLGMIGKIFDQQAAMYTGITSLGKEAIDKLLKRDAATGERRVLIDVKHMSLQSRKEYYALVNGKDIPIIFSHGAVTGYSWSRFLGEDTNSDHELGYFSHVSINLYNEDIEAIVASDGLIGLSTHEGRMPGGYAKKELKEVNDRIRRNDRNLDKYLIQQRHLYIKLFMGNVFQIVKTINNASAWDHICIGSDYDGIMDPFDRYKESDDFNVLFGDIFAFLNHPLDVQIYEDNVPLILEPDDIKKLMFGLKPRQIVEKLSHLNIERFLSNYFTDTYRLGN
ncbi:MAG: hypothetical protein AAGA02_11890 [Bacteroidota bacterium]